MIFREDLSQTEVQTPINNWCGGFNGGHVAVIEWEPNGLDSGMTPTRFFHIVGHGVDVTVCEPCLIIARWIATRKKA